jgi:prephenate dehydratase
VFVFEELVDSLLSGRTEQAVMAINSIAGPIIPNYALIDKHNLHIIGGIMRIHQNLMAQRTNNRRYRGSAFASDGTVVYGLL